MLALVSRTGRDLQRYNEGRRQVVGCIPYRYKSTKHNSSEDEEEIEVLVISSQKGGRRLMFPKGGWETDESMEEAALREAVEEAGVRGRVGSDQLGEWKFMSKSKGTFYEGYMFPLLVENQLDYWPEMNVRQRIWMSPKEARDVCQHWWMKEALDILVDRLSAQQHRDEKQVRNSDEKQVRNNQARTITPDILRSCRASCNGSSTLDPQPFGKVPWQQCLLESRNNIIQDTRNIL